MTGPALTDYDWRQVLEMLRGTGMEILSANQQDGTVLMRVPQVRPTTESRPTN